ncbi:hypothetical protein JCM8097_004718 [Rhodosporidiobolus ruineniae]
MASLHRHLSTRSSPTSSRAPSPSRSTSPSISLTPARRPAPSSASPVGGATPTKKHTRPPARVRTETGGSESYYNASASGSQTESGYYGGGRGGGYGGGGYDTSSSDSDEDCGVFDEDVLRDKMMGLGGGLLGETPAGEGGARGFGASAWGWAGERGRGEHVLVEKRSTSPSALRGKGRSVASGFRRFSGQASGTGGSTAPAENRGEKRSWATTLLDTLDARRDHHHQHPSASKDRRRPSSPSFHSAPIPRSARASPRPRMQHRVSPDTVPRPRSPSPPLTLDSINGGWNPFSLFHIRRQLIFEVTLLVLPLLFALFRLHRMAPTAVFPSIPTLPTVLLTLFTLSVPFLALFRRPTSAFHPPFTDARGFRDPAQADDGVATALTLPILLASAVWYDTYARADGLGGGVGIEGLGGLVEVWEANGIHATGVSEAEKAALASPLETARALFTARYELVLLTFLNAVALLVHLGLSKSLLRIEKLPKSNAKRFFGFMGVATVISTLVGIGFSLWSYFYPGSLPLSPLESVASTYIQQSSFYLVSRLARRGFTLGELNTMTAAGNALCLEFWRLSRARWYYKRSHPSIPPTFRTPTPIIAFQAVLIPGAFLSGFLLSPLLVLSRNIASRPSHRLKWPTERSRHRRLLALGVLVGLVTITFLFLGGWTSWILSSSHKLLKPWTWAVQYWYFGASDGVSRWPARKDGVERKWWDSGRERGRGWRRIALTAYWATVISSAIGGWQTHLVRARRVRMRTEQQAATKKGLTAGPPPGGGGGGGGGEGQEATRKGRLSPSTVPGLVGAAGGSSPVAATFAAAHAALSSAAGEASSSLTGGGGGGAGGKGDQQQHHRVGAETARVEKASHASLNMRRKFFHALAVVMFVPGIAVDPAFTSLSFSLAFTLFTFAEYARFFALYPLSAPLHIFFTEFVDNKDAGPVILSHFYLLTGCAGGLWLEGKAINRFTGVLVLGVGDSMASIFGKLLGRHRWPGTHKTVEGTAAFVLSVGFCAWVLRLVGIGGSFSLPRYLLATSLAGLLEAASAQNDNLVIPIYMWSLVALFDV